MPSSEPRAPCDAELRVERQSPEAACDPLARSQMADVDNGVGEGLRRFLRHVVANIESPVLVRAREVVAVSGPIPRRREWIVFAINGYGGHRDNRRFLKLVLDARVLGLTRGPALAPAVITDDDTDEIRVAKGGRGLTICWLRELPRRGVELPDEQPQLVPVLRETADTPLRVEVVLVPPGVLCRGWEWLLFGGEVGDQVAGYRDQSLDPVRPQHRDDVAGPRPPVIAGQDRVLDLEGIHERENVDSERRLVGIPGRCWRQKGSRAIATEVRHDHPVAARRQQWRDLDVAVDVVREAVHENNRPAAGVASFRVSDIEDAGVDLLQRAEGCARSCHRAEGYARSRRSRESAGHPCRGALRIRAAGQAELGGTNRNSRGARGGQKAAATRVDFSGHSCLLAAVAADGQREFLEARCGPWLIFRRLGNINTKEISAFSPNDAEQVAAAAAADCARASP